MIVAIEGCIGSGKSTTAKIVSKRLDWAILLGSPLSSMFLEEFYSDPDRIALETELGFLLVHYHQLRKIQEKSPILADFAVARDLLFAQLNLSGAELKIFEDLYKNLASRLERPVLTIYLRVPVDELIRRIRERGRLYELQMTVDYLTSVNEIYENNLSELGPNVHIVEILPGSSEDEVADEVLAVMRASGLCT
jgi:deoxyguanosine kinase